jgi:hypothetical protein
MLASGKREAVKLIELAGTAESHRTKRLFEALSQAFPVRFQERGKGERNRTDAVIDFGTDATEARDKVPTLRVSPAGKDSTKADKVLVQFTSSPSLPAVFRGRTVETEAALPPSGLRLADQEVLASISGRPIWAVRGQGAEESYHSAIPLPNMDANGVLFEHFASHNFLGLLPLIHFLHRVIGADRWTAPPLRACFMFDDPNLHWPRYGHVDFRELALSAERHHYHASFATIPMDGWYVHRGTAEIFRQYQSRLSLLCHGNNHTTHELARDYAAADRQALVAQALQRIGSLERRSKVQVSRVMAAPHGACSEELMGDMARLGFEAACISHWSNRSHNPSKQWNMRLGLAMAEMVADLPLIPRFRIFPTCQTDILLAAFLNQPIIPVGHHEDVADGLALLEGLAGFINSLGEVQWLDMQSIARSNFFTLREAEVLQVKMYSRKIRLAVPPGIEQLCIHRPWLSDGDQEGLELRLQNEDSVQFNLYRGERIPIRPGGEVEIASIHPSLLDSVKVPVARTPLWAVARRQLCEIRDRMKPAARRLFKRGQRRAVSGKQPKNPPP